MVQPSLYRVFSIIGWIETQKLCETANNFIVTAIGTTTKRESNTRRAWCVFVRLPAELYFLLSPPTTLLL